MKIAENIMTPNPKMIASGECLPEVIKIFLENGVTSSPVINPLGEILGVLTELSLVKAYLIHKSKLHSNDKVGHQLELLEKPSYIDSSATLSEILKEMISAPTHRLLVRDSRKKIIGILSPKDIMRAMIGESNPQGIRQKLKEAEEKLQSSLSKLHSLEKNLEIYQQTFHETPYMMHSVDINGKIIMANKKEHELLGYSDNELIGKTIYDIYEKEMHQEAKNGLLRVVTTGQHNITFTTLVKKDGSTLRCDIASSAITDENGKFVSTISVLRHIDSEDVLRMLSEI